MVECLGFLLEIPGWLVVLANRQGSERVPSLAFPLRLWQ